MQQDDDNGMKYFDMFRDRDLAGGILERIRKSATRDYTFMEVCGGHTAAIHRFGIPSLLPDKVRLISGPGCPVCVTGPDFIEKILAFASMKGFIIATFGDLMRIPGMTTSLEKVKAEGNGNIRVVYSSLDALEIAENYPSSNIIFPAIGFETTSPGTAVTVKLARKKGLRNFFILSSHKVMPPAMKAILSSGTIIDGFICPGHVAAITGSSIFRFIPEEYSLGCVVTGFEPLDLLQSVFMLIEQVNMNTASVQIQYSRVVTENGNEIALRELSEVFEPCDSYWRGFGNIAGSGLRLSYPYEDYDAEKRFPVDIPEIKENSSCKCGDILRGIIKPEDCPMFGRGCTPENPAGACMVSAEGACNIYYKYRK